MTTPPNATLLDEAAGIELWSLASAGDQFVVRTSGKRARLLQSSDSARQLFGSLVRQARGMRAH